jgi:hypothetical protein
MVSIETLSHAKGHPTKDGLCGNKAQDFTLSEEMRNEKGL